MNLADSLLELDAEDLTEIYHMVSEWEFNFSSLEVSLINQKTTAVLHNPTFPRYHRDPIVRTQTL